MSFESERRRFLYGPHRETAANRFKQFMMTTSVFPQNILDKERQMETTNLTCFSKKSVELDRETAKLSTEIQRKANFKFGTDEKYPLISTKAFEFTENLLHPVKRIVYDLRGTNIPDFSPSCVQGQVDTNRSSVYSSSYQTPKSCFKALGKSRQHLKDQTEDMRSTHFALGCEKRGKYSETAHSYNDRIRDLPNAPNEPYIVGPASVFCKGDWNMSIQGNTYCSSVSHDNFGGTKEKSDAPCRSEEDRTNRRTVDGHSTNFKLGCDKYLVSSLYKKDFRQEKFPSPQNPQKTLQEVRPKSAKVLNETTDITYPISNERLDFVYRQKEANDFLKDRGQEYQRNQTNGKKSSVTLEDKGYNSEKYLKPVSMSEKDYQLPPIELIRQHKIYRKPAQKYDYLVVDKSLPIDFHRKKCALQAKSSSNLCKRKSGVDGKDEKRPRDDNQTHFTLGHDTHRYPNSEQHDQFVGKTPMLKETCLTPLKRSKEADIVRCDDTEVPFPKLSVMKNDYQATSKLSSSQQRIVNLNLKYPRFIAQSHYFHMDHEPGKKTSATATDYAPPEVMTV